MTKDNPSVYPVSTPTSFHTLLLRARSLVVYRGVLEDGIGYDFLRLLDLLSEDESGQKVDEVDLMESFSSLLAGLLSEGADTDGDLWQEHLARRILEDANPFSELAGKSGVGSASEALTRQVESELRVLQALCGCTLQSLGKAIQSLAASLDEAGADALWPLAQRAIPSVDSLHQKLFANEADWAVLIGPLAGHYAHSGAGIFARFNAFRWVVEDGVGELEGIPVPDPVTLDNLIGYEREKEAVLRNTRHFAQGRRANNVLLYGDSGTGKSSLVKALLNTFAEEGLRLIEVPKEHVTDFPYIMRPLRGRMERFIIFVDDFSFEEHETEYKAMKALLEGSIEARPENVLVYATSNRRHLIKERFSERSAPGLDDVHPVDTMQEKLSLADRFGIRVAFIAPDQDRYLAIVAALAEQEGLPIKEHDLRNRAIQWAQMQNGFSGRTARQFIDDLVGELSEAKGAG